MNKPSNNIVRSTIVALCMIGSLSYAEDNNAESPENYVQDHISVRSRHTDPQKRERMHRLRAQEKDEETKEQEAPLEQLQRAHVQLMNSQKQFAFAPRHMVPLQYTLASTAYTYPINCHWVASISENGSSIELEDGSHWDVSPSNRSMIYSWNRSDHIVVTPNYSWFSSYDYHLTNKTNNTHVKANLWIGPLAYGPYSHWIVDMDYYNGHIFLENQMVWCVDPRDNYIFKEWSVNDHVIFGINNSWFTIYDHVLINANMDDHVRVKQY